MKITLLLSLALVALACSAKAQTTISIKNTALQTKITALNDSGWRVCRYDYLIEPTIDGIKYRVWVNNYHGKWYSNYPYIVVFSYNRHISKLYKNGKFIYANTWGNKNYYWIKK
jgi:hypothetical protein